jgi:hypothetical protein
LGSTSVLVSTETNTASIIGISAFCLDEIVGGKCCGGLVQGNVAAFGTRMCLEEILPGLGRCAVKGSRCQSLAPGELYKGSTGQGMVSRRSVQGAEVGDSG